jgi:hypothetical protein
MRVARCQHAQHGLAMLVGESAKLYDGAFDLGARWAHCSLPLRHS